MRTTLTIRVLIGLVMLLPFLLAVPYAMFGHTHDPLSGFGRDDRDARARCAAG